MLNFSLTDVLIPYLETTELEDLLQYLKRSLQIDLTGYKRASLMRRTLVRMQRVGIEHYQGYLAYLQQQPDEATHLLDTIFINFTGFFRDRSVWDYLAHQIIPQMIANTASHQPICIWSAGCASGEETYSLAMLLMEALGLEQFQQRVRIHGTDIDTSAISQARQGHYSARAVAAIPPALLDQYFQRHNDDYCWRQDLYGSIRFHRHNLIQMSVLPRIDLLVCRNLLMYFTSETQTQVLSRFHYSLRDSGLLLLGQAENLVVRSHRSLFKSVHPRTRAFTKVLDPACFYNAGKGNVD